MLIYVLAFLICLILAAGIDDLRRRLIRIEKALANSHTNDGDTNVMD